METGPPTGKKPSQLLRLSTGRATVFDDAPPRQLHAAVHDSRRLAVHVLPRLLPLHGLPCLRWSGGLIGVPGLRPVDRDMMAGYQREGRGREKWMRERQTGCGRQQEDDGRGKREHSGVFPLLRYTIRLQAEAERQAEPRAC